MLFFCSFPELSHASCEDVSSRTNWEDARVCFSFEFCCRRAAMSPGEHEHAWDVASCLAVVRWLRHRAKSTYIVSSLCEGLVKLRHSKKVVHALGGGTLLLIEPARIAGRWRKACSIKYLNTVISPPVSLSAPP